MKLSTIQTKLLTNTLYHIYNHGNNKDNIFYREENYEYFLKKYFEYLFGYVDTFVYCLLPNHFHMLIRVKSEEDVLKSAKIICEDRLSKSQRFGKSGYGIFS
jgi:REP element-mobilizing transposase RayT